MKKVFLLIAIATFAFVSCDKEETIILNGQISDIAEKALFAKFPNARITDIDHEGTYTEVEILDGKTKRTLRFDSNSKLVQTKTNVRKSDVPADILSALKQSTYGSYRIDDIDYIETPNYNYYEFELEKNNTEVRVQIKTDGTIL